MSTELWLHAVCVWLTISLGASGIERLPGPVKGDKVRSQRRNEGGCCRCVTVFSQLPVGQLGNFIEPKSCTTKEVRRLPVHQGAAEGGGGGQSGTFCPCLCARAKMPTPFRWN
ncbi:hypothetical protein N657DRAFT_412733 [Parathielavia appendiculata]|uniref:Secreted protein n=1 Tax=Parathielavia appendiculata TaxID=2587402 RepID=A0AAN6TZC9_9PEZI|nr:hypothetical protein N657DRAFT_412733 [Parathielavia appendiculata]